MSLMGQAKQLATGTENTPKAPTVSTNSVPSTDKVSLAGSVNAASYTADLDPKALAANQAKEQLASGSSLMQLAKAQGNRQAARRGFTGGSSIAAGASMAAMADKAMPMILNDANANERRQSENLAQQNETSRFNADGTNRSLLQNAAMENDAKNINRSGAQDINRIREQGKVNSGLQQEGFDQDLGRIGAQTDANLKVQGAGYAQDIGRIEAQQGANVALERVRQDGEAAVAYIRATHDMLIQSNASASHLYASYQNTLASIYANPEITPSQAARASGEAMKALEGGLEMIDSISAKAPPAPVRQAAAAAATVDPDSPVTASNAYAKDVNRIRANAKAAGKGQKETLMEVKNYLDTVGLKDADAATLAAVLGMDEAKVKKNLEMLPQ